MLNTNLVKVVADHLHYGYDVGGMILVRYTGDLGCMCSVPRFSGNRANKVHKHGWCVSIICMSVHV